MKTLTMPE